MCPQKPAQLYRNQHTFELMQELDKAAHAFVCHIQCTRHYKFVAMTAVKGRAHCLIGKRCNSADSNVITSQTIETEKCLRSTADGMPWSLADSLEERSSEMRHRAAEQLKSHCCLCQTLWVNSLTPELNAPPDILIYFQSSIYSYNADLPEQSFCVCVCFFVLVLFLVFWRRPLLIP